MLGVPSLSMPLSGQAHRDSVAWRMPAVRRFQGRSLARHVSSQACRTEALPVTAPRPTDPQRLGASRWSGRRCQLGHLWVVRQRYGNERRLAGHPLGACSLWRADAHRCRCGCRLRRSVPRTGPSTGCRCRVAWACDVGLCSAAADEAATASRPGSEKTGQGRWATGCRAITGTDYAGGVCELGPISAWMPARAA